MYKRENILKKISLITTTGILLLAAACSSSSTESGSQADSESPSPVGAAELDASIEQSQSYGRIMTACLADRGFVVTDTNDGGFQSDGVPPEQQEAYEAAVASCASENGFDDSQIVPLSAEALSALYDRLLEVQECLIENGYSPEQPISRDAFIEGGSISWHPYISIVNSNRPFASDCPVPGY